MTMNTSSTGLNAFVTWIPGQKTRIMFNGEGSYTDIRSKALGQSNSGWGYSALVGIQQVLPWDLRLSVNSIFSGRTVSLQGWTSGLTIENVSQGKDFVTRTATTIPLQMLSFNLSYSFGKQDNATVKKSRKTIEEDIQLNSKSISESLGSMMQMY